MENRTVPTVERRAYKLREAAAMLGIKEISLRRLIARGKLRPCRALRHLLLSEQELQRFLANE